MKHTLKNRIKTCPRCKSEPCRKNGDGEFIICKTCELIAKNRKQHRDRNHIQKHMEALMRFSRIPQRHSHADLKKVKIEITDPETSYLFIGDKGLGKTYTMVALAKELILQGKKVRYVTVPELMMELRDSFTDTVNNEHKIINKYLSADYLFLDDIGVEKSSEWVAQILFILIDRRYMDGKHICVSSNLSLQQISDKEHSRIVSRLIEMCEIIEFKGSDRRISK